MKRHASLIPLTHDHHHALAQARRMKLASESGDNAQQQARAEEFLEFFAIESLPHFRDEEERLFPLLVERGEEPSVVLVRALIDHQVIHAEVLRLQRELTEGQVQAATMLTLATKLEEHVRLEEKELFPLIERTASEEALRSIGVEPRARVGP